MQQLENIFFSKYSIKILRHLALHLNWEFTLGELANDLNLDKSNIFRTVRRLRDGNVVLETKKGKFSTFRLNKENFFVKRLVIDNFILEKNIENEIFDRIVNSLRSVEDIVSIVVYGSFLTAKYTFNSDIDVLLIIKSSENENAIQERYAQLQSELLKEDTVLTTDTLPVSEFLKLYRLNEPFIVDILKNGKTIHGRELSELV